MLAIELVVAALVVVLLAGIILGWALKKEKR